MDHEAKSEANVPIEPATETPKAVTNEPNPGDSPKSKKPYIIGGAVLVVVLLIIGVAVAIKKHKDSPEDGSSVSVVTTPAVSTPTQDQGYHVNHADSDSLDPVTKGKSLTYGQCDGTGTTTLTHAPMDPKDIGTIAPEGGFGGAHVTPIDHEYYYGLDTKAAADTYPVYAVMDGNVNAVGNVTGQKTAWNITLSHSCTFMAYYNLMTSLAPNIMSQLPSNWKDISGNVKIPVKAGDIIGYSGGQSLDFQLANTEKTLPGLLYHNAYNFAEPVKINGVKPLDYFAADVKTAILPKYLRSADPRDGQYDYDIAGKGVGNWFQVGTNGYGGAGQSGDEFAKALGHLSLAYDSIDPTALVFSIGNYQGKPQVFAVKGTVDWTKITKDSGLMKVELAQGTVTTPSGGVWNGASYVAGLKYVAGPTLATALLQMTDDTHLKVEVVAGKKPAEVTSFSSAAVLYDRGQDTKLDLSTPTP